MSWDYKSKQIELMQAAQKAYDILVKSLEEEITADLGSEKMRTAIQAKKVALDDAMDFLNKIQELETAINKDEVREKEQTWGAGEVENRVKGRK